MEIGEKRRSSSGYGKSPWIFKGSALYQIHLVKAETARAFIPKDFRLVEAFGYTLGGFFLASYEDSPAGVFDELVVIAGIVWNPPTSCAWAARVLVNSHEACDHGRKDVGLPSHVARFSKRITAVPKQQSGKSSGFSDILRIGTKFSDPYNVTDVKVTEVDGSALADICNIRVQSTASTSKLGNWMGPSIKMSLPSFSGNTNYNPNLLKYSCHIECRVRPVKPAIVSMPMEDEAEKLKGHHNQTQDSSESELDLSVSVMLSKPIIALQFKCLEMQVEAPIVLSPSKTS
ncbi:PREDICTED: protein NEOXANTHIN-DEFICIENT 1 isoform X2 [Tarenaya hassleriana]|nr:PREDICTED: protein NEOXANTHIN-DEFICIENT 1 isoform X2 [Tarenaya hassleriana]XP_010549309.1 PREDICTED: protein NEOXANTHIN-DEFICIENT 1 isoform X2 [Tarenaya hassleriana]